MRPSSSDRVVRGLCRIYDVMLLAYPPTFRREYGREMAAVVRRRAREVAEREGCWAFMAFLLQIVSDWLRTATRERLDEGAGRSVDAHGAAVISLFAENNAGRAPDSERSARAWSLVLAGLGAFLLAEGWVRWFRIMGIWR